MGNPCAIVGIGQTEKYRSKIKKSMAGLEVAQLIDSLSRPAAYPHPVDEVEVHRLHGGLVLLDHRRHRAPAFGRVALQAANALLDLRIAFLVFAFLPDFLLAHAQLAQVKT